MFSIRGPMGDIFRNDNRILSLWLPGFRIGNPNPSRRQSEQFKFFQEGSFAEETLQPVLQTHFFVPRFVLPRPAFWFTPSQAWISAIHIFQQKAFW